jgi:hypothetical protein
MVTGIASHRCSPKSVFCANRRDRFAGAILAETMDCASIDTCGHACVHSIDAVPMTAA